MPDVSASPPAGGPTPADLRALLDQAARAPSLFNTQPWRFAADGPAVHLYADRGRQLRGLDPHGRELTISCGAALAALRTAARHAGWRPDLDLLPSPGDPDHLATVTLHPGAPPADDRAFRALALRHTDRHPFLPEPIPPAVLAELCEAGALRSAAVVAVEDRPALARAVARGIRDLARNAAAQADIQAWLRPADAWATDGVSDAAQGAWDRHAERPTEPEALATYKARLVREAPAALVVTTAADDPAAWLDAGRALARVLLSATDRGLVASFANEPLEAGLRDDVAALADGRVPQIVFRVGIPRPRPATPRRPVHVEVR